MTSRFAEIIPRTTVEEIVFALQPSDGLILEISPRLEGNLAKFAVIQTRPSCCFHLAIDFPGLRRGGSWSQIINQAQDFPEQFPRHRHLGQLERDVAAMAEDLRTAHPCCHVKQLSRQGCTSELCGLDDMVGYAGSFGYI